MSETIKELKARNCITHSHACDCREAKFDKLAEENKALKAENHFLKVGRDALLKDREGYCAREALLVEALEKLDQWQGSQACNASVYEIEDDEFGHMQFLVHEALNQTKRKDNV